MCAPFVEKEKGDLAGASFLAPVVGSAKGDLADASFLAPVVIGNAKGDLVGISAVADAPVLPVADGSERSNSASIS